MSVSIQLDMKGFNKGVKEMPKKMYAGMKIAFRKVGDIFLEKLVMSRLSGRPGLKRTTGTLARSFKRAVFGSNIRDLNMIVFTDSKYARIHEHGGKIKPKKGSALAIPLKAAKTRAGRGRVTSPRHINGLWLYKREGRPPLLMLEGTPMFVLLKSVKIKPRLQMFKTWDKQEPKTVRILNTAVGQVLQRF
ncbi:hypothetical protein LCGC14_0667430 [marine sediment metagenome]|uniref:Uncharacterized protein n=1 Tax=marine sediment metagenome TaxID=412755 RepID=A0A0F9U039_9ZZZZ